MQWDATYLTKRVRVVNEYKVLGVSEEQAKQFEQGRIMLNSLTPLFSAFVFIITPKKKDKIHYFTNEPLIKSL